MTRTPDAKTPVAICARCPAPVQGSWRLRRPRPAEWRRLSGLVLRSKAHWGYSAGFLAHFAPSLTVRPAALVRADCVVAARGRHLLGYAMRRRDRLEDLFVAPEAMGLGIGTALFAYVRCRARAAGWRTLTLDADPFAARFYRGRGARTVGWTRSPWPGEPGRRLPRMRLPTGGLPTEGLPTGRRWGRPAARAYSAASARVG